MKLNGSQIVVECLKEQGVDTVFGYPGGAILNVYDELYKHPEIRHVLTSHEQGASHAADGYARSTGKVGVCMATSGPGATNLVTVSQLRIWIPFRSWQSLAMLGYHSSEKTVFRKLILLASQHRLQNTVLL